MMPLTLDSFGGVGGSNNNNPWHKPASPSFNLFDAPPPMFKTGDPLDDSVSSSSGDKSDRQNPSRYKTELCRPFEESGACKYGEKCQFAHGRAELRSLNRHPKYKTELCRTFHTTGICPYGPRCHFLHAEALGTAASLALKRAHAAAAADNNNGGNHDNGLNLNNKHNNNNNNNNNNVNNIDNNFNAAAIYNNVNHNSGNNNAFLSVESLLQSSTTPRPSNLNLCLNNHNNTNTNGRSSSSLEGEISPPSASSSASVFAGCSPLITPSSTFSFPSSSSSSSSVWGPSPAPMSPCSTISSFSSSSSASSSSHFSGDGSTSVMDLRPVSPSSSNVGISNLHQSRQLQQQQQFLNVPAVAASSFATPPPTVSPATPFPTWRPSLGGGGDFHHGVLSDGQSPPPEVATSSFAIQQQPNPAAVNSSLNPAASAWISGGGAKTESSGGGAWNSTDDQWKGLDGRASFQRHNQQQQQQQQQQALSELLGGNANFDQLSKMIVNELLERLKQMIAGRMNGSSPQLQQQALMQQIQALLSGGVTKNGGGSDILGCGNGGSVQAPNLGGHGLSYDPAMIDKTSRNPARDRWMGSYAGNANNGDAFLNGGDGLNTESMFDKIIGQGSHVATIRRPPSRVDSDLAPFPRNDDFGAISPPLRGAISVVKEDPLASIRAPTPPSSTDEADEDAEDASVVRLPIFSQLTK